MAAGDLPRGYGDIQTAVVNLVARLAPAVAVSRQPGLALRMAEVIAAAPNSMAATMCLRQSVIRGVPGSREHTIQGLAAWVTVIFDLANLRHDRRRAMAIEARIAASDLACLARHAGRSRNGCIIALPHAGSLELFASLLVERGFSVSFVFTIGNDPTPTERWLLEGRRAMGATPIRFGQRDTRANIERALGGQGVVLMIADVYPSVRYGGIPVRMYGGTFNLPPGPARFSQMGTVVLPGFAGRRDADGFAACLGAPVAGEGPVAFTQSLADHIGGFTMARPDAFWLWHPIPNDPFQANAPPGTAAPVGADDEAVARAIEVLDPADLM